MTERGRSAWRIFMAAFFVLLLAAVIVSLVLAGRAVDELRRVRAAMEDIRDKLKYVGD